MAYLLWGATIPMFVFQHQEFLILFFGDDRKSLIKCDQKMRKGIFQTEKAITTNFEVLRKSNRHQ
jgi:hypothetical protein